MRRMLRIVIIVIEVTFKAKEEEGRGGIDRFAINPSDKEDRNLAHLLPFLPVPLIPMLHQRHSLLTINLYLLLFLILS